MSIPFRHTRIVTAMAGLAFALGAGHASGSAFALAEQNVMGLGNALYGEITFKDGKVVQSNYGDYRVMRINAAPRVVRVHLVPSDKAPGGIGEPGVPPLAPALANAIFAATGRRIRSLPVGAQLAPATA